MELPFLELYRDTRTGDVLLWAGQDGRYVRLRYLGASPGDEDGVLVYNAAMFLGLLRRGILEVIPYIVETDG